MARKLRADDEVVRFHSVWLGPPGYTLPWHARYYAYVLGFWIFIIICLFEALAPGISISIVPIWEMCITIMVTSILMTAVDHDKPLTAILRSVHQVTMAPAPDKTDVIRVRPTLGPHIKTTKDPLHAPSEG